MKSLNSSYSSLADRKTLNNFIDSLYEIRYQVGEQTRWIKNFNIHKEIAEEKVKELHGRLNQICSKLTGYKIDFIDSGYEPQIRSKIRQLLLSKYSCEKVKVPACLGLNLEKFFDDLLLIQKKDCITDEEVFEKFYTKRMSEQRRIRSIKLQYSEEARDKFETVEVVNTVANYIFMDLKHCYDFVKMPIIYPKKFLANRSETKRVEYLRKYPAVLERIIRSGNCAAFEMLLDLAKKHPRLPHIKTINGLRPIALIRKLRCDKTSLLFENRSKMEKLFSSFSTAVDRSKSVGAWVRHFRNRKKNGI